MLELGERSYDVEGKDGEWHTAFYYLAEHVRDLTGGRVNHKELYALVGVDGRYVNHANPLVRKRTAGALSRIVHSRQYALDMRSRYFQDGLAFARAARAICDAAAEEHGCDDGRIVAYLRQACWPDVYRGLRHEKAAWRGDLDLFRAECEMHALFANASEALQPVAGAPGSAEALAAVMHVIAFGHLDFAYARSLVDARPTGPLGSAPARLGTATGACLVRFADADHSIISGSWTLTPGKPFTIGRYTDCDVLEVDARFSRVHCCLYFVEGSWHFEDMGSRNGSAVLRGGSARVYDSAVHGAHRPMRLQHGDVVVLAGQSHYWFGARRESAGPASVGLQGSDEASGRAGEQCEAR